MRYTLLLLIVALVASSFIVPAPASEKLFKEMIANRPNHLSQPGTNQSIKFQEFQISKPVNWTMEFGNSPDADKNTKVYKVNSPFYFISRHVQYSYRSKVFFRCQEI